MDNGGAEREACEDGHGHGARCLEYGYDKQAGRCFLLAMLGVEGCVRAWLEPPTRLISKQQWLGLQLARDVASGQ